MTKKIEVTYESAFHEVPVRSNNRFKTTATTLSISVPTDLVDKINHLATVNRRSRSSVIVELIEKGLTLWQN